MSLSELAYVLILEYLLQFQLWPKIFCSVSACFHFVESNNSGFGHKNHLNKILYSSSWYIYVHHSALFNNLSCKNTRFTKYLSNILY